MVPIFSPSTGQIMVWMKSTACTASGEDSTSTCAAQLTAATFPGSPMVSSDVPTTILSSRCKVCRCILASFLQASGFRDNQRRRRSADAGIAIPTSGDAQGKGFTETQSFTAQCICTSDTWCCLQSGAAAWSGVCGMDEKPWKLSSLLLWCPGLVPMWMCKGMAGLYWVCRAIGRHKVSSCRRQRAPGWFGRCYSCTSLFNNKFRVGSDFLKHSYQAYWKGWIFLIINKEMIPPWPCKSLLRKWPALGSC